MISDGPATEAGDPSNANIWRAGSGGIGEDLAMFQTWLPSSSLDETSDQFLLHFQSPKPPVGSGTWDDLEIPLLEDALMSDLLEADANLLIPPPACSLGGEDEEGSRSDSKSLVRSDRWDGTDPLRVKMMQAIRRIGQVRAGSAPRILVSISLNVPFLGYSRCRLLRFFRYFTSMRGKD